jgi:Fur family ferric uptake transcriptional regulator
MPETTTSSWGEHAQRVLIGAGHQRGGARARIIDLLARQTCALSAIEIDDALRAEGTPIGRASIYRVLDLLVEHRLVERLTIDHGHARFERIEPDGHHHHHLLCDRCGQLVAFDDPGLEHAIERLSKRLDLHVEHHDVLLHGACSACAS